MTPKTLAALRKSIEKWDRNTRVKTPHAARLGAGDCPLCALFRVRDFGCTGCPVREKTGYDYCDDTPYEVALHAHGWWRWHSPYAHVTIRDAFHKAAAAERDFLISLLPPGELP